MPKTFGFFARHSLLAGVHILLFSCSGMSQQEQAASAVRTAKQAAYAAKPNEIRMVLQGPDNLADVQRTMEVLKQRFADAGLTQVEIRRVAGTYRIALALPQLPPNELRQLLAPKKLEIWNLRPAQDTAYLQKLLAYAAQQTGGSAAPTAPATNGTEAPPLLDVTPYEVTAAVADTARLNRLFGKLPPPAGTHPAWEAASIGSPLRSRIRLHLLKAATNGRAAITGPIVKHAEAALATGYDGSKNGRWDVQLTLTQSGGAKFAQLTRQSIGQPLAIVIDRAVYSAPIVLDEISGNNFQISSTMTAAEAHELATSLNTGELPTPLIIRKMDVLRSKKN